jgi:hypothetical protein
VSFAFTYSQIAMLQRESIQKVTSSTSVEAIDESTFDSTYPWHFVHITCLLNESRVLLPQYKSSRETLTNIEQKLYN